MYHKMQVTHHRIVSIILGLALVSLGCADEFKWAVQTCSVNDCTVATENWSDLENWIMDDAPATRLPCWSDNVVFPDNYTLPRIIVDTEVTVLRLKWRGTTLNSFAGNITKYFTFKDGGSLKIDSYRCIDTSPCSCTLSGITPSEIALIASLMIVLFIAICVIPLILLVLFGRKLIRKVRKRGKTGEVFTFQTLNEIEIEDETDKFDVMAVNNVDEFPSGKSNIPADLTGLLDEDSVNGEVATASVKSHSKKVADDKQALLNDQDEMLAEESLDPTTENDLIGTQTDL